MVIDVIADVARVVIGYLFLMTGLLKIPVLKHFFITVVQYGILKGRLARVFAYTLPFAEFGVGFWLLGGWYLQYSSVLALLLISSSTLGVAFALYQKKKMDDCGCYGGVMKIPLTWKKLVENCVWLVLILVIVGSVYDII